MKDGQQSISVNQIKVSARAGATIYHAISESVIMAFEQEEIVILRHNQKEYVIDPGAIHGFIFNAANSLNHKHNMEDGIINLDTDRAKNLGFTSDKYDGYLWKIKDSIYVSFIVSKRKGNFRDLVNRIIGMGFTVKVPTPLGRMEQILKKSGYQHTIEPLEETGEDCEVWVLKPQIP